jgi:hypothetical protein
MSQPLCTNGHENSRADQFCTTCGLPLSVTPDVGPTSPAPDPVLTPDFSAARSGKPRGGRALILVAAVVVLGLVLAGVVALVVTRDRVGAATYATVSDLHVAYVKAGFQCRKWDAVTDPKSGDGLTGAGVCINNASTDSLQRLDGAFLQTFVSPRAMQRDVRSTVRSAGVSTNALVAGGNWSISVAIKVATSVRDKLGGTVHMLGTARTPSATLSPPESMGSEAPATSGSDEPTASSKVDCAELNEVQCQEANAIAEGCPADPSSVGMEGSPSPGLTKFTYLGTDEGRTRYEAFASGEYRTGAFVESCGLPSSGVNIVAMHKEIASQSRVWLDKVVGITCHAGKQPIDQSPVGTTVKCDVWDESGFPNQAEVTVGSDPPHFQVQLLFGD